MHSEDRLMLKIIAGILVFIIIAALAEAASADGIRNNLPNNYGSGYSPNEFIRIAPPAYEMQQFDQQRQIEQQNQQLLREYNNQNYTIYDFKTNTYSYCQKQGNNIYCY